ncbi:MAG: VWA domain-containing protein [Labilithrix sp.]|nr:VWA domain-containing protein [Labilithrix sp.]MCW5833460.1 VWA domain-containing protein [Labilithrix sp.]
MILAGLGFAQLAAIFGAAAAFATALYILKLRRRTVAVPFSKLWEKILRDKEATSLFSRLKRLLSLLVQLALLALLAFALGDPRAAATLIKGRNLVVIVDASASMQATDVPPAANRLEAAKDEVKKVIRGLGGSDRMLIAQMDAAITPLGPTSSDTSELERALDSIKATDARADFPRALRFATDSLRGVENAEIVVVSDGRLGEAVDASGKVRLGDDVKLSYIPIGRGVRNVGITAFSVRRYPLDKSRYEVMLEVTNTGPETEDVELSLFADPATDAPGDRGQLVDLTKLRLKPGERLPRFYPNLSGASRALEAHLEPLPGSVDELPADDRAYALLPERRRAKVLVVTVGNTYLEAALLLDEYLDVQLASPREYAEKIAPSGLHHDVVIFDGATPADAPRAHAIYLDPRGPGSPVKVETELKSPGFDRIERKHPIVRWTALDDVNIARGRKLVPQPGDKVVGASVEGPILVTGQRGGYKFVAMGFDVRDSDLPLRVAWPLLLLNSVNFFTDEDAQYISSFRTGDVWRVPVVSQTGQAKLRTPRGGEVVVPVHEGRAVYLGEHAGFYELAGAEGLDPTNGLAPVKDLEPADAPPPSAKDAADNGGAPTTTAAFAANLLDAEESSIEPAKELVVDGKKAGTLSGFQIGVRREIWIYLLVAAIVLTAIEWITYHRRITV